jgi:hypothetical protein
LLSFIIKKSLEDGIDLYVVESNLERSDNIEGDGSLDKPFDRLHKALAIAKLGDRIHLSKTIMHHAKIVLILYLNFNRNIGFQWRVYGGHCGGEKHWIIGVVKRKINSGLYYCVYSHKILMIVLILKLK